MYLTPRRIEIQLKKADHLQKLLWRLYSPYKKHRKLIVKASYLLMEVVEVLEELKRVVVEDFKREETNPLSSRIPPGYHENKNQEENKNEQTSNSSN